MSTLPLAGRMGAIQPSPTLALTAKVRSLRDHGVDVIALNAGEPDFNTPDAICEAAKSAIDRGLTKYTPSSGLPELKAAIVEKLKRENGIVAAPEQIIVSCGAKHALYNAFQALLNPGDEVVLIAPYWPTYADQLRLAGAEPRVVHTTVATGFVPHADQLKEAIGPKTRAIVVNSPSNPTGAILPRQTLKEIAALALRHGLWVITDEIYERLTYGAEHESIAALGKEVADQTVTITGCSKSYSMTGWRIGFSCAPISVAKAMANIQDQVTSNPTSFAQVGAVAALNMPQSEVEAMRDEFRVRRDLMVGLLGQIPGVQLHEPQGAFYVFPDVSAKLGPEASDDAALAAYLLEQAHVAVVPGSPFEGPGHVRLSYAASRQDIERGCNAMCEALERLTA